MNNFLISEEKFYRFVENELKIKKNISKLIRSPHLWHKFDNQWLLRHTVNKDGLDD